MAFKTLLILLSINSLACSTNLLSLNSLTKGVEVSETLTLNQTKVSTLLSVDLCDSIRCTGNTTCLEGFCIPSTAIVDFCEAVTCPKYYSCWYGICFPTLASLTCPVGQTFVTKLDCSTVPCFPTIACQPINMTDQTKNSCNGLTCPTNYTCFINMTCVPICATLTCPINQTCVLKLNCSSFPSYPTPTCQPINETGQTKNSCNGVQCPTNYTCFNNKTCIPTCASVICPTNQTCVTNMDCSTSPCCPTPVCQPTNKTSSMTVDSCKSVKCPKSSTCTNGTCVFFTCTNVKKINFGAGYKPHALWSRPP